MDQDSHDGEGVYYDVTEEALLRAGVWEHDTKLIWVMVGVKRVAHKTPDWEAKHEFQEDHELSIEENNLPEESRRSWIFKESIAEDQSRVDEGNEISVDHVIDDHHQVANEVGMSSQDSH